MLFPVIKYGWHWLNRVNEHSLHSPWLTDFYHSVIVADTRFSVFDKIEHKRSRLLYSNEQIHKKELGTGASKPYSTVQYIQHIAKNSLMEPPLCRFLFRAIQWYNPENILELGTSLGITTQYISAAAPKSSITTVEGCPETLQQAQQNMDAESIKNVHFINAGIDQQLPALVKNTRFNFVVLDANHSYDATLRYGKILIENTPDKAMIILDDINKSYGMHQAWKNLKTGHQIDIALDLNRLGILIKKPDFKKESYSLHFPHWP